MLSCQGSDFFFPAYAAHKVHRVNVHSQLPRKMRSGFPLVNAFEILIPWKRRKPKKQTPNVKGLESNRGPSRVFNTRTGI